MFMGHRVICIGRQFGSGGHEIAVRTAERLGIKVYERELLHLACKYGELSANLMEVPTKGPLIRSCIRAFMREITM